MPIAIKMLCVQSNNNFYFCGVLKMLEACLMGSNKSFPDRITYTAASANVVTGSTSGVPVTNKRAGSCYIDHNGDIMVIGGTGASVRGEKTTYKYNKFANSLSLVNSIMTDSSYYLSSIGVTIDAAHYVFALGYNTFDAYLSAVPTTRLGGAPTTFGTGDFNHALHCVKKSVGYRLFNLRRSASNRLTLYGADLTGWTSAETTNFTIASTAPAGACSSAESEGKIYAYTGAGYLYEIDPLNKTIIEKVLTGITTGYGTLNNVANYAYIEKGYMYVPFMGTNNMIIIDLKTLKCSMVSYSLPFAGESATIFRDGRIYSFFGNSSTWNIRNYPQL